MDNMMKNMMKGFGFGGFGGGRDPFEDDFFGGGFGNMGSMGGGFGSSKSVSTIIK
jgi:hypothetical protein